MKLCLTRDALLDMNVKANTTVECGYMNVTAMNMTVLEWAGSKRSEL